MKEKDRWYPMPSEMVVGKERIYTEEELRQRELVARQGGEAVVKALEKYRRERKK